MRYCLVLIIYIVSLSTAGGQQLQLQTTVYQDKYQLTAIDTISINGLNSQVLLVKTADSIKRSFVERGFLNLTSTTDSISAPLIRYQSIILGNAFTAIAVETQIINSQDEVVMIPLSRKRKTYITPAQLEQTRIDLRNQWNEKGQPFAKITSETWDFTKKDTAKVLISIKTEASRTIDKIVVQGYPKYPSNQINNLINKRSSYNSRTLDNIQKQISSLEYLEVIKEPEALFKKDSTILYIYVKKKQANTADGLLGFNTDESGKLELNGFLEASLRNNFNYGERIDFEYRNDNEDQSRLGIHLDFPALLKERIGVAGGIQILRRDSLYQNTTLSIGINYQLPSSAILNLRYLNRQSTGSNTILTNNFRTDDYDLNGIAGTYSITRFTNNRLQPEEFGIVLQAGLQSRNADGVTNEQYVLDAQAQKLWELPFGFFLDTGLKAHLLKTDNLRFNELQQIGGPQTIRGFNQNSIDTAAYSLLQTDLRYVINDQIYLNLLTDAGVFEDFIGRNPQYLYSFGAGLGILTKAGILRLEVANGRFIQAKQGISSTIAHLNLRLFF